MTRSATLTPSNGEPGSVVVAVHHLHAAATVAETNSGGHPFSPWSALASQIRLTADSIDPTSPDESAKSTPTQHPETASVASSLRRAAESLDQAAPSPEALQWIWQVHQLRRLSAQLTAQHTARLAVQPSAPA